MMPLEGVITRLNVCTCHSGVKIVVINLSQPCVGGVVWVKMGKIYVNLPCVCGLVWSRWWKGFVLLNLLCVGV